MDIKLPPFVAQPAQLAPVADSAGLAQLKIQGSILTAVVESSTAKGQLPGQPNSLFEVILKTDGQRLTAESAQAFRAGQLPGQPNTPIEVILKTDNQRFLTESAQALRPGQLPGQPNSPIEVSLKTDNQRFLTESAQALRPGQLPVQPNSPPEVSLKTDNQRFLTESAQAFRPGQLLRIEVLPDASIRVLEILQPALPTIEGIVQRGLREALPLQQNPSILLNNLVQLRAILVQFNQDPAAVSAVRQIDHLVQSLPTPEQVQRPTLLKANVANSGSFLEAKLQQHSQHLNLAPATKDGPQPSVREALQANAPLAQALGNTIGTDLKAQLLSLATTLTPLIPAISASPNPQHSAATALISRIIFSILPAPAGDTGIAPREKPALQLANVPLEANLANLLRAPQASRAADKVAVQEKFDLAMSTVLRQLAATIARVQANQFTSLASQAGPDTSAQQSWHIEIPVFNEGQFRTLQLIVEREPYHEASAEQDRKARQWNITLGFDFQTLGEFYATLRIADNTVSTTFWSERPQTLQLIRKEIEVLEGSLQQLGLEVKQIDCRKGTPPLKASRLDQQLVDIET